VDRAAGVLTRPSVVRAWLVAHELRAVLTVMAALTVVLVLGSDALLPVPGAQRPLPVWQLIPALYAAVASVATTNALPARTGGHRVVVARACWCASVVAVVGACVSVVDLGSGLPALAPASMVMVAATFAIAPLLGRGSVCLGAAAMVHVVVNAGRYTSGESPWTPGPSVVVPVVALVVLGLCGYALLGPSRGRFDKERSR
jgi:hypothetical protein